MMHEYDPVRTSRFFAENSGLFNLYENELGPSPRDRILLEKVLPTLPDSALRIVDYGCGAGGLLAELARRGYDVLGIEPNDSMRQFAIDKLKRLGYSEERVRKGDLDQLRKIESETVDLLVAMGVFQYLSDEEYAETLKTARRILKPHGHLVCTFQNAFFDLFTFNEYTIDFFEHQLLRPLVECGLDRDKAISGLRSLVTNPELSAYDKTRARDNIFVRLSNPLTIGKQLKACGLELEDLYFYTLHPVPPLIKEDQAEKVRKVSETIEVEKSQEWYAYFMGNAFLTHCRAQ